MSSRRVIALTVLFFAAAVVSRDVVFMSDAYRRAYVGLPQVAQWLEQPLRWLAIVIVGLAFTGGWSARELLHRLGLRGSPHKGVTFGIVACSPMLVGALLVGLRPSSEGLLLLVFSAGVWPLAEEILYRGFAFGQLHRQGGIPWLTAAALTGVAFGLVHLGQSSVRGLPFGGVAATIALIAIGGLLYAWLYARWRFDLWIPVSTHAFMNLWWSLFGLGNSPLGGWYANVLRLLSVGLAILLTLRRTPPLNAPRPA